MAQTLRSKAIQEVLAEHSFRTEVGAGVSCTCGFLTGFVVDRVAMGNRHVADKVDERLNELQKAFS